MIPMKKPKTQKKQQKKKHGLYFCLSYIRVIGTGTGIAMFLLVMLFFSTSSRTQVLGASTSTVSTQCTSLFCYFQRFFSPMSHLSSVIPGGPIRHSTYPTPTIYPTSLTTTPAAGCYYAHTMCPMYACRIVHGKTICPPCATHLVCPTGYPQVTSGNLPPQQAR